MVYMAPFCDYYIEDDTFVISVNMSSKPVYTFTQFVLTDCRHGFAHGNINVSLENANKPELMKKKVLTTVIMVIL